MIPGTDSGSFLEKEMADLLNIGPAALRFLIKIFPRIQPEFPMPLILGTLPFDPLEGHSVNGMKMFSFI